MSDWADTLLGSGSDLNALQMSLPALLVFVLTLASSRVAGRSSVGRHRPFDTCTTVLLGAVLSRAVVGASLFWPTVCAGAVIVLLHRLLALASQRLPAVERLVAGKTWHLVVHDRIDAAEMRRGLVTDGDPREAVRKKAGDSGLPIEATTLERDGVITIKLQD